MGNCIRELAYLKWEAAGRPPGDGVNFWVEAETEVELTGKGRSDAEECNQPAKKQEKQVAKVAAKTSKGTR